MARPIEFCREKALQSAIEVFWSKGYEAASLEDLVTAMGIGRQSLYNTYGDKRGLFIQAVATQIENYAETLRQHFQQDCSQQDRSQQDSSQQDKSAKQLFASWFHGMSRRCEKQKRLGCLLVNTSMELAGRDQEIADLMVRNQRNQEDIFCRALEHAVEKGELKADYDCRKIARYLVGCAAGMIVIAKADPNSPNLDAMASVALQILEP